MEETITTEKDGTLTIISYKINEDGKKVKTTRRVKKVVRKEKVNHSVALRKEWKKFGQVKNMASFDDGITSLGEEVYLKLSVDMKGGEEQKLTVQQQVKKLVASNVTCRVCQGEHWTAKCPYKDTLKPIDDIFEKTKTEEKPADTSKPAKYVPPSQRAGGSSNAYVPPNQRGAQRDRRDEDATTIRVSNLAEETTERDLQLLFSRFGPVSRTFLSRDRDTGYCKGFAYINYLSKESGQKAIDAMDGHGFGNLILKVDWAKRD